MLLLVLCLSSAGGYRLVLVCIGVGASLSGQNSLLLVHGSLYTAMYASLCLDC
ncbi:hypothetical protein GOY11_34420 [Pseudomonas aeruginosa]|nr:hypothetical protein [Pseudomonas aeruginosa]